MWWGVAKGWDVHVKGIFPERWCYKPRNMVHYLYSDSRGGDEYGAATKLAERRKVLSFMCFGGTETFLLSADSSPPRIRRRPVNHCNTWFVVSLSGHLRPRNSQGYNRSKGCWGLLGVRVTRPLWFVPFFGKIDWVRVSEFASPPCPRTLIARKTPCVQQSRAQPISRPRLTMLARKRSPARS